MKKMNLKAIEAKVNGETIEKLAYITEQGKAHIIVEVMTEVECDVERAIDILYAKLLLTEEEFYAWSMG